MTKARDLANASTALSAVSATELAFVDGVTSAIQTQMDAKAPSSTAVTLTGTQTLTNKTLTSPVIASVVNNTLTSTTGDIIYASSANTPARLGIGSSAQVLTVASGVPSWSTPVSGAPTQLATSSLSGVSTVTFSSISGSYKTLFLRIINSYNTNADPVTIQINGSSAGNYSRTKMIADSATNTANTGATNWNLFSNGVDSANTGAAELYFPNYTATGMFKSYYGWTMTGGTPAQWHVGTNTLSANKTAAITSITINNNAENWDGGTATLFGVN